MCKVITFYSYKGGTGRTMALANVAYILAQQQEKLAKNGKDKVKNVLAIDWDLEAPSLHRYFRNLFQNFHNHTRMQFGQAIDPESALNNHPGLIDFFSDLKQKIDREDNQISEETAFNILNEIELDDFVIETDIPYLRFLKAGKIDEEYINRVGYFDWHNFFYKADGLFYAWAEKLADKYSYALIDSRAGITDIGNICTMIMPEKLVAVFVPNRQSVTGLTELIERATSYRAESEDPRPLVVFPLPSRIELGEKKLRDTWRYGGEDDFEGDKILGYQPKFEELFQKVYSKTFADSRCDLGEYFGQVQIPHIPRYAYGEDIATLLELPHSPQWSLAESYQRFTQILLKDGPWEEQRREPETQRREIIEIERAITKANRLTKTSDLLRALVVSLQTSKTLQKLPDVPIDVRTKTLNTLDTIIRTIRERNRLEGHNEDVCGLDFSPTGDLLVSASKDKTLKLWKIDGQLIATFTGHQDTVKDVSFSPNGNWIASASEDKTVKLWRTNGELEPFLNIDHEDRVLAVCFSPDSQMIVSASADKTVKLWQLDGTKITKVQSFKGHNAPVSDLSFSPQGDLIASASEDGTVKLWRLNGEVFRDIKVSEKRLFSVSFSPDGKKIAASGSDGGGIWDLDGNRLITLPQHQKNIFCITFNQDISQIATASSDGTVRICSVDGTELETFRGHIGKVQSVRFNPKENLLISGGSDNTVRLWQTDKPLGQEAYNAVSFRPKGEAIVSAGSDGKIKLWNLKGIQLRTFYGAYGHKDTVCDVCWQPQLQQSQAEGERLIASASDDGTVRLWKPYSRRPKIIYHWAKVKTVSFSPDGQLIASGGTDSKVKLWKLEGTLLKTFEGHDGCVWDVTFSPDGGQIVASASADGTIRLWDLQGDCIKVLKDDSEANPFRSISFSPDGSKMASASGKSVKLWKLDNGQLLGTFKGHKDVVSSVCFTPDGQNILSASYDNTLKLWTSAGAELQTFDDHAGSVRAAIISPDGQQFLSASSDGTIRLWQLFGKTEAILTMPQPEKEPDLGDLQIRACEWLQDFLRTNPYVNMSDRYLCAGILI